MNIFEQIIQDIKNGESRLLQNLLESKRIDRSVKASFVNPAQGRPPLMWAARYGNYAAFRLLIEYGADTNHLDTEGHSIGYPLCQSIAENRGESRKLAKWVLDNSIAIGPDTFQRHALLNYILTEDLQEA